MRHAVIYLLITLILGSGIAFTLWRGQSLPPRPAEGAAAETDTEKPSADAQMPLAKSKHPFALLLLQLIVILVATRVVGYLFTKIGQPAVMGHMAAGIFLGPSLFGLVAPEAYATIFPGASLDSLKMLAQIGVCLYLFVIGLELDVNHLRGLAHTAIVVSHASILLPFFLGVVLAPLVFGALAGPEISFVSFALFMGISLSITAFPVLARILQERGIAKTPLGATALTCAAVDDVTAWILLAVVVAFVRSTGLASAAVCLGLTAAYVAAMLFVVCPLLTWWFSERRELGPDTIAVALIVSFLSAMSTEWIGIHALFGAFLAGVIMPQRRAIREYLEVRLESVSVIFLLPLFFAATGLRTRIGLLNDAQDWGFCLLILATAVVGKFVGGAGAAALSGVRPWDSFRLGALMNTRGLMELVVVNIGYDLGILSPEIFAMLVLMALATTFMTGPLLSLADRFQPLSQPGGAV